MATTTYDVNVQLALATTAELEGDYRTALEFLVEAHRLSSHADRATRGRVLRETASFHIRQLAV